MDTNIYFRVSREAALKAGRMLKDNIDQPSEIFYKGIVDLVTNFDTQAQRMIFDHISSCFPGHDYLAEEGLSQKKGAEFRWIIFTVSIALEKKGEVILGLVYDPMKEEMFSAVKGEGAFLNEKEIRVSAVDDLDKSLLATGFPYDIRTSEVNNIAHFNNFLTRVQGIRRCGSAAMDLCYVACGRFDGFWELKLSPWDMAAGALIVQEAGGRISDFQDEEFTIFSSEILASNGLIHQKMVDVLTGK